MRDTNNQSAKCKKNTLGWASATVTSSFLPENKIMALLLFGNYTTIYYIKTILKFSDDISVCAVYCVYVSTVNILILTQN